MCFDSRSDIIWEGEELESSLELATTGMFVMSLNSVSSAESEQHLFLFGRLALLCSELSEWDTGCDALLLARAGTLKSSD